jgi:hypothetical protein
MTWQEIRNLCPSQWVVVEAIGAYTEEQRRVINELVLLNVFGADVRAAWVRYEELHRADRYREYYVIHTERKETDIRVLKAFGRVY